MISFMKFHKHARYARCVTLFLMCGLAVLIAGCISMTVEERPMSQEAAASMSRSEIDRALFGTHFGINHDVCAPPYLIAYPPGAVAFVCASGTTSEKSYGLPFEQLPQITVLKASVGEFVTYGIGTGGSAYSGGALSYATKQPKCTDPPLAMWRCIFWKNESDAQHFVAGLQQVPRMLSMIRYQQSRVAECGPHPVRQGELSESVRSQQVLAEHYFDQRNLGRALRAYETGLEREPCWADGWFNAGQIAAELGDFTDASQYMERFVKLDPKSKDAEAARNKIVIWRDEAQNAHEPAPTQQQPRPRDEKPSVK